MDGLVLADVATGAAGVRGLTRARGCSARLVHEQTLRAAPVDAQKLPGRLRQLRHQVAESRKPKAESRLPAAPLSPRTESNLRCLALVLAIYR